MPDTQIAELFEVHRLNELGLIQAGAVAEAFILLLETLQFRCDTPLSRREWSIIKTKLQEASFFAKRAVALDPRNQLPKE